MTKPAIIAMLGVVLVASIGGCIIVDVDADGWRDSEVLIYRDPRALQNHSCPQQDPAFRGGAQCSR